MRDTGPHSRLGVGGEGRRSPPLKPEQLLQENRRGCRQEMRRYRHAAVEEVTKRDPRCRGGSGAFLGLGQPEQGSRPSFVRYPENADFRRWGGHKHALAAHNRGRQVWIDRGYRYLFPADELGRSRQLVFIADRARVATKEVEVDKDRVVWTVG